MSLSWESEPSDLNSSISGISDICDLDSDTEKTERLKTKRPYAFHDRRLLNTARNLSAKKFRQFFRMERETFQALLATVKEHLPDGRSPNKQSLTTEEKLLAFLMFISSNEVLWTAEVSWKIRQLQKRQVLNKWFYLYIFSMGTNSVRVRCGTVCTKSSKWCGNISCQHGSSFRQ